MHLLRFPQQQFPRRHASIFFAQLEFSTPLEALPNDASLINQNFNPSCARNLALNRLRVNAIGASHCPT
jgi:hypothetical protein